MDDYSYRRRSPALRALASAKRRTPQPLTFRHWTGVTPYTSSFELAGSCVFDKQSPGVFRCGPYIRRYTGRPYPEVTAAVLPSSLARNHSFTLVYSTCLPVSVYGTGCLNHLRDFSWKALRLNLLKRVFPSIPNFSIKGSPADFLSERF